MLSERDDLNARCAVVSQRARGETQERRVFSQTARDHFIHDLGNFPLRFRRVFVSDVGAPDAREFETFGLHGALHHVAALALRVVETGVGYDGDVRKIRGVIRGVVKLPERLFPRGEFRAVRPELLILRCLREARARRDHRPHPRMMRAQMPRARAAHREAAQRQPPLINGI